MKEKVMSVILFCLVILAVTINTVVIQDRLSKIGLMLDEAELSDEVSEAYESFKKSEVLLGFSTSHEDLTDVSEGFVELISYLDIGDNDSATVTKNRLKYLIEHLRRLSGINIESII